MLLASAPQKFVRQPGMPADTAVRVYRRYLKLEPAHVEEYIAYCKAHEMWGEAAKRLAQVRWRWGAVQVQEGGRSLDAVVGQAGWLLIGFMVLLQGA